MKGQTLPNCPKCEKIVTRLYQMSRLTTINRLKATKYVYCQSCDLMYECNVTMIYQNQIMSRKDIVRKLDSRPIIELQVK